MNGVGAWNTRTSKKQECKSEKSKSVDTGQVLQGRQKKSE